MLIKTYSLRSVNILRNYGVISHTDCILHFPSRIDKKKILHRPNIRTPLYIISKDFLRTSWEFERRCLSLSIVPKDGSLSGSAEDLCTILNSDF